MSKPKIVIIGLGQIGYHDAQYITKLGHTIDGYDINEKAVKRALNDGVITGAAENLTDYDNYIIAISTHDPADMFTPYLDGLTELALRLSTEAKPGSLLAIESTIPPGYSRNIMDIVDHKLHIAHIPHRFFIEDKEKHGVRQLRVLSGCEKCCAKKALNFYKETLDIPVYPVDKIEYAELSKVVENTHRFLEIAFAEELKIFCDSYGLSFTELREAVNTKWNENILEARSGIGGHCLPKDSQMYLHLADAVITESILTATKQLDKTYVEHMKTKTRPKLRDLIQLRDTAAEKEEIKRLLEKRNILEQ